MQQASAKSRQAAAIPGQRTRPRGLLLLQLEITSAQRGYWLSTQSLGKIEQTPPGSNGPINRAYRKTIRKRVSVCLRAPYVPRADEPSSLMISSTASQSEMVKPVESRQDRIASRDPPAQLLRPPGSNLPKVGSKAPNGPEVPGPHRSI